MALKEAMEAVPVLLTVAQPDSLVVAEGGAEAVAVAVVGTEGLGLKLARVAVALAVGLGCGGLLPLALKVRCCTRRSALLSVSATPSVPPLAASMASAAGA